MDEFRGIGTDIIEIERIKRAIKRHGERFLNRIFTEKELNYCLTHRNPFPHLAGRFAAKEASVKALGTGFNQEVHWKDIEIVNQESGKPKALLAQDLRKQYPGKELLLSISHCREYAIATALLVGERHEA